MSLHTSFLRALQDVATVHLVSRLHDERLDAPDENDLRIFIPDLHLVSDRVRDRYSYNTNHTPLLTKVLHQIAALRHRRRRGQIVSVYQLGDFLDLWREEPLPDRRADSANAVFDSHEALMDVLLSRGLKARFLLGNHDMDLHAWPNYRSWSRRYYIQTSEDIPPTLLALHGDIFDWIEKLPDAAQQLVVYLVHPYLEEQDYQFGEMKRVTERMHQGADYSRKLQGKSALGASKRLDDDEPPKDFNVKRYGRASKKATKHFAAAREVAREARRLGAAHLRCIVMGHTHHARIVIPNRDSDDFFALVDCGAWIEKCSATIDGRATTMPNAQIGAISANEIRIYQLSPIPEA